MYDPTSPMTEILRYTRLPNGMPTEVRSTYIQTAPGVPGSIQIEGMPEDTWWSPSDGDVPEDERMTREEYDAAIEEWRRTEAERQAQERVRLQKSAEARALRRAYAREELTKLGLSENTVDILLGSDLP